MAFFVVVLVTIRGATVHAQTTSDFITDVQRDSHVQPQSDIRATVAAIRTQDYITSWDEFGTNVLIDGANTSTSNIHAEIVSDIIADLQNQLTYDQTDHQYLTSQDSSPEEVVTLESAGGNDLTPENYIEPNPSIDANPDVDTSALDTPVANPDSTITSTSPDIPVSNNLVPPDGGEWQPDDIHIFETIIDASTPGLNSTESTTTPDGDVQDQSNQNTEPTSAPSVDLPSADAPSN